MVKILILVGHYLPGYKSGGALRTIVNMVEHLGEEFEFRIITSDRDIGDDVPYSNVYLNQWNIIGDAHVYYLSPEQRSISNIANLIRETKYDILYLNSFFDPVFTIRPLLARFLNSLPSRPIIIAPRGEFAVGALRLKKWKKRAYFHISRLLRLYQDVIWQASSDYEVVDINRTMGKLASKIVVAPDALQRCNPLTAEDVPRSRLITEPLRICILSRIAPIKNLDYCLNILSQVSVPVIFDIYGPKEDEEYWLYCESLIKKLPSSVKVSYHGSIDHHHVNEVLRNYDLFFFPTKGENFGHVIFESISAGTPLLIANTTPWRNLESLGVGWDLPLESPGAFVTAIENAASLGKDDYVQLRNCVRNYAEKVTYDSSILDANRQLFLNALDNN